jgi:hypothetical protein
VTILDEDIPDDLYQLLLSWRLRIGRIGIDVGRLGMKDREIVCSIRCTGQHSSLSIEAFQAEPVSWPLLFGYLDVHEAQAAEYIRRTLRDEEFNTRTNEWASSSVFAQPAFRSGEHQPNKSGGTRGRQNVHDPVK